MLNLYRRHIPKCPHRSKGSEWTKCACPLWCDGELDGKRVRRSLKTRDQQRALRRMAKLESSDIRPTKPIEEAIETFLGANQDLAPGTLRNYRRTLRCLGALAEEQGCDHVSDLSLETLDLFRASRNINPLTWTKELQILRHFFKFCCERKWTQENPAKVIPMPRNLKPAPREPYTREDIVKILSACDRIGRGPYERLRARAMVLALRYTGLRIGDVATLAKDRIRNGEVHLYTMKSGKPVKLPVHPELQAALDQLPLPRGGDSKHFFWSGWGTARSMIRDATRTLRAVFKASGVPGAHAHRFRHTLATEILERGGSIEDAADILGNSPAIIRKHYAKWTARRQERISNLMEAVFHGTFLVQTEKSAAIQ